MQRLYRFLQPALFALPAETAHGLGMAVLRTVGTVGRRWAPPGILGQTVFGVHIRSPVGLAAGFDKDAVCLPAWPNLGFGFVEVGTVTPVAQPGNPKPRLYRLREERSLQNWMGFNGRGVAAMRRRLAGRPAGLPLGVNIGKNAATTLERAVEDYQKCAAAVADRCDFLVVNVSSPNTSGLRSLQQGEELKKLLLAVLSEAKQTPVLVKLSPDEELEELARLAAISVDNGATGVVASNTSVDYSMSKNPHIEHKGGLSGDLIRSRSRLVTSRVARALAGRGVLISVGGIATVDDLYWRLRQGALLAEIYTGLIYDGPDLPRRLAEGLAERMVRDGASAIADVIGVDL